MKRLLLLSCLLSCLLLAGCIQGAPVADGLRYLHDDAHGVGCWGWSQSNANISCLPDSAYRR